MSDPVYRFPTMYNKTIFHIKENLCFVKMQFWVKCWSWKWRWCLQLLSKGVQLLSLCVWHSVYMEEELRNKIWHGFRSKLFLLGNTFFWQHLFLNCSSFLASIFYYLFVPLEKLCFSWAVGEGGAGRELVSFFVFSS